jgi:hypothetical protein
MKRVILLFAAVVLVTLTWAATPDPEWKSLFNGKNLDGWTVRGKASSNPTKDGEWFDYRIKMVGNHIEFWINEKPVMTYDDDEYKKGFFAIQCHNPGMVIEAKDLYYRDLSKK